MFCSRESTNWLINFNDFQHSMVYECWCVLQFLWTQCCKLTTAMANVFHCVIKADVMPLADVVAIMIVWQMVSHKDRCYDIYADKKADVIAIVVKCGRQ